VPIYFSAINYGIPVPATEEHKFSGKVILFAGIADIALLAKYVSNSFELIKTVSFKDHYDYKSKDIEELVQAANQNNSQLLTTEKDMVKIRSNQLFKAVKEVGLFYLPISVQFLFNEGGEFDSLVKDAIISKYEKDEAEEDTFEKI
jgi:tetraacyldisaccharide 4'-kinase